MLDKYGMMLVVSDRLEQADAAVILELVSRETGITGGNIKIIPFFDTVRHKLHRISEPHFHTPFYHQAVDLSFDLKERGGIVRVFLSVDAQSHLLSEIIIIDRFVIALQRVIVHVDTADRVDPVFVHILVGAHVRQKIVNKPIHVVIGHGELKFVSAEIVLKHC